MFCDTAKVAAERFFRRVRPDLVIVDCLLIGGYGLQLARRLALQAKVPVIVTSGDPDRADEAEQAGFVCFRKPFRLAELVAVVERLLADKPAASSLVG